MGDIVGRKNAYISAFIIFFASSIGCGFSRSFGALVGCRALQGLGGSGLYSLSVVIFPEITPNHLKKWIGTIIGVVLAIAGVLGSLFGGIITHYTTWRWVFWIK
jgi:MFS family permease